MWYLNGKPNESFINSEDAFNLNEINAINQIFDNLQKIEGEAVGQDNSSLRKSKISWLDVYNPHSEWVYRKLTDLVLSANQTFFQYDLYGIESLQLTEYDAEYEGRYGKHVDYGYNSLVNRKLSFSLQLNSPDEYEGGELIIHNSSEPIHIERKQGLITFFSSFVLHEVSPITKGKRRSLVGWVSGPQFK